MGEKIRLLSDHVANQIAAGEVVQRPASVVKELLENAIDSGATHVSLILKEGGKTLIQVVDDGSGMSETDARMAFERHATSKIREAEDLFDLYTKGFRGEALASIAAVAHVSLKTKEQQHTVGTEITIEGSTLKSQEPCSTPVGTAIVVKNLFYNIPARRNFLKSHTVELRHCLDEFHRVALIHPEVRFDMYHNGSDVFRLPSGSPKQRIVAMFGDKMKEKLVPIEISTEIAEIHGFICKPETAKKTRGEQFFFANHRFIRSPYLHHAIVSGFEGLLKEKTHPGYFITLDVPRDSIDINIHPTKTEVKFEDEQSLYTIIRSTVKHSLGQFSIAPTLDFTKDARLEVPYAYQSKAVQPPEIEVDSSYNPFHAPLVTKKTAFESGTQQRSGKTKGNSSPASWESLHVGLQEKYESEFDERLQTTIGDSLSVETQHTVDTKSGEQGVASFLSEKSFKSDSLVFSVFQLYRKYIVTSTKSTLVLIHQQRAHERILYENVIKNITHSSAVSQQLMFPVELQFSTRDCMELQNLSEYIEQSGFRIEIEPDRVKVTGIPVQSKESEVSAIFHEFLNTQYNNIPDRCSPIERTARAIAKTSAIKSGTQMSPDAQQHLVHSLFACEESQISPEGKKIVTNMSIEEIDRKYNTL